MTIYIFNWLENNVEKEKSAGNLILFDLGGV